MHNIEEEVLAEIFQRYKGQRGFVINTWEEFRDFAKRAYPVLIERARKRSLVTYKEVAVKIGLSLWSPYFHLKIGYIVGACSDYESINNRPLLSAIAVNGKTNYPGSGFWGLPRVQNHIRLNITYSDIENGYTMTDEMLAFWTAEVTKVYEWWQVH